MADLCAVELGEPEQTGTPLEGGSEPTQIAFRSEDAKMAEELPACTAEDAVPPHENSMPRAGTNLETAADSEVLPEPQSVVEQATAAAPADAEAPATDSKASLLGLADEDSGISGLPASETTQPGLPASETTQVSTDASGAQMAKTLADETTGIVAQTTQEHSDSPSAQKNALLEEPKEATMKVTDDMTNAHCKSCEDTLDKDESEAGDSTGAGCTTESETTSCTGQTEEDITVRDDAVTHDVTAAQSQAAALLVEIASLEMHSESAAEPEELRVLLLRLSEAHAGLERALEDLQADSLAIMESNAELHTAIASTLRDLTQSRSSSSRTPREFAPSPEALLGIAKNYWQQVKSGRLNILDQGVSSEQGANEQPDRPEWVARSQELGRQVRDQLKTLTSKVSAPAGSDSQPQLAKQLAEQKQKLQEQLREHWSALATRTSSETGKQVVEKSREIKKQLADQLNPAHVQQATLQLQSQVVEGYQNLSTKVSQDFSEVINKLPWRQDASAVANGQVAAEDQAAGILSACDQMDDNSASSAGATGSASVQVDALSIETTEGAPVGQDKVDETNQLPFMDMVRNHIARGWTLPGKLGWGAAGEAKSASTLRNNKAKRRGRKAEEDDDTFSRVLVELQVQLGDGKVATANLKTSDSRSRVASQLVHEHKLPPAVKRPLKAILKKAVANAEKYPVQITVTHDELLHPAEGL